MTEVFGSREEIFERLKKMLVENIVADVTKIAEESLFEEDLSADSLDIVELLMEIEDVVGVKIPDEIAAKLDSVGDVLDYLCMKLEIE